MRHLLKELLLADETLVMPDAYDPLSARMIEWVGFKAVQCSGYSISLAACYPTGTDVSYQENLSITEKIVNAVRIPAMADGEDGFTAEESIENVIQSYVGIGVAGINLEDQVLPSTIPTRIIEKEEMVLKLRRARSAALAFGNLDFVINGRTDALRTCENRRQALDIAVERANEYLANGADLAFVAYVATLDEVKTLVREVKGPISIAAGLPYNINHFSINQLKEVGVARVSLPSLLIYSAMQSWAGILSSIRKSGSFEEIVGKDLLLSPLELSAIIKRA
jgi:2-methylisocitrate lyase-like PEP mutase family enzyme